MKLSEFDTKVVEYGIEGTGISTTTTQERKWTSNSTGEVTFVIPAGVTVHVNFSPNKYSNSLFVTYNGEVKISRVVSGHKWLKGIRKSPSIKTLEKWSSDGIAKSVCGQPVEPDGFDHYGSPSWMLVVGVI